MKDELSYKFYESISVEDRTLFSINTLLMVYHLADTDTFHRANKYGTKSKRHETTLFHCYQYYKHISRVINDPSTHSDD